MPERGAAIPEYAIILPVLILVVLTIAQLGFWMHARNVASSAAQVGVQAGTARDAAPGAGMVAANEHLEVVGSDHLRGAFVSSTSTNTHVTITVQGNAQSVIPGIPLPEIKAVAQGTQERVTR